MFSLSEPESIRTVGKKWELIVQGIIQIREIEVTLFNPDGCEFNCGNPDELELRRYEKTRGDDDFRVTTETVRDRDYFLDETLGYILAPSVRERDTTLLYECFTAGRDFFLSTARNCEGERKVATLGRIYTAPSRETTALYRCFDGVKHSASIYEGCEGLGRQEAILGYILL